MTTTPAPQAPDTAAVDHALDELAATSAEVLSGVLAAQMLDVVGRPSKLPTLLWPDLPAEAVQEIWDRALAVGYRAGRFMHAPRWEPEALDRLRAALEEDGFELMGRRVRRTAACGRRHPADSPAATEHP